MLRLAAVIYALTGPPLAGILIIAVLTMGLDTTTPIVAAGLIGFVAALPAAWIIARYLRQPPN